MRRICRLLLLTCLLLTSAWGQEDSLVKLRAFLDRVQAIEKKALTIEPMPRPTPPAKFSPKQTQESNRRLTVLDELLSQQARPLAREIAECQTDLTLPRQSLSEAAEHLNSWLNAKLSLQSAAANDPSLELLRQNEPLSYKEYQVKLLAAQENLK